MVYFALKGVIYITTGGYIILAIIIFSVVFTVVRTLIVESKSMQAKRGKLDKWERELAEKSEQLSQWQNGLSLWQVTQIKRSNALDTEVERRVSEAITKGANKKLFKNTPTFKALSELNLDSKNRLYNSLHTRISYSKPPDVSWAIHGNADDYIVTLNSCTCKDYQVHRRPCKHMLRLGIELGLLQYADDSKIYSRLFELEDLQNELNRKEHQVDELYELVDLQCTKREKKCKDAINKHIKSACKDYPPDYVASLIAGLSGIFDDDIIYHLDTKGHPAYITAEQIRNHYKNRNEKLVYRAIKAEAEADVYRKMLDSIENEKNIQPELKL